MDGVFLVIRLTKNGRPAAERAREILHTLQANVLGVVVNGVGKGGRCLRLRAFRYGVRLRLALGQGERPRRDGRSGSGSQEAGRVVGPLAPLLTPARAKLPFYALAA